MEPLKPQKIKELTKTSGASEADVAEYQRLLATRTAIDPARLAAPEFKAKREPLDARIRQFYQKLFGAHEPIGSNAKAAAKRRAE